MASAPAAGLPLFYKDLQPLSSSVHGEWKARALDGLPHLAGVHAVPLTVEEFPLAQRHYPIVFTAGAEPTPLALMGLNEGVNTFVDEDGSMREPAYIPAYARRYPFMLARLRPDVEELSLCFDPTAGTIGAFEEGTALFEDGKPSAATLGTLEFCEKFEQAGQRTAQFVREIVDAKLLIDGEFTIEAAGGPQPYVYRGFQFIAQEALAKLRGDVVRKMVQSGAMGLIYAHLFSLDLAREIFARQSAQDKLPPLQLATA